MRWYRTPLVAAGFALAVALSPARAAGQEPPEPPRTVIDGHDRGDPVCLAFSPDSTDLGVGTDRGEVRVYDPSSGRVKYTVPGHGSDIRAIAFAPDGKSVAVGGDGQVVRVWDVLGRRQRAELELSGRPWCLAYSADGTQLAAGMTRGVMVWSAADFRPVFRRDDLPAPCFALAFSPDGRRLGLGGAGGSVSDVEIGTGRVRTFGGMGHERRVTAVRFAGDGRALVSASTDHTVKVWDAVTGAFGADLTSRPGSAEWPGRIFDMTYVAGSDSVVFVSALGEIVVQRWSVAGRSKVGWVVISPPPDPHVGPWAVSPDGWTLAMAAYPSRDRGVEGGRVLIYDLRRLFDGPGRRN